MDDDLKGGDDLYSPDAPRQIRPLRGGLIGGGSEVAMKAAADRANDQAVRWAARPVEAPELLPQRVQIRQGVVHRQFGDDVAARVPRAQEGTDVGDVVGDVVRHTTTSHLRGVGDVWPVAQDHRAHQAPQGRIGERVEHLLLVVDGHERLGGGTSAMDARPRRCRRPGRCLLPGRRRGRCDGDTESAISSSTVNIATGWAHGGSVAWLRISSGMV